MASTDPHTGCTIRMQKTYRDLDTAADTVADGVSAYSSTRALMPSTGKSATTNDADLTLIRYCSKQARRTGMAGPLGEMFDHGA